MIADNDSPRQAPTPNGTTHACATYTDAQDPQVCPTCGRPYFDYGASGLLDLLIEAQDRINRAKARLEQVVLP